MKKISSLIFALFLAVTTFAQTRTIFVNESFNGIDFPEGWEFKGGGKNNWSISESNLAGGEPNELKFSWTPKHYGMARIVTKAVDMTNVPEAHLSLKHFVNNTSGSENTIGIATTSDDCATWNVAWSQTYSSIGFYDIEETISTPDMGKTNVRFCIFFDGESNSINEWCFDDFKIIKEDNYNINLLSIDLDSDLNTGEADITFTIQNEGVATVNTFEARYEIEGIGSVTQIFNTTLGTLKSGKYTFDIPAVIPPGTYRLTVEILSINGNEDSYPNNNKLQKDLYVSMGLVERKPLIEHFSASTCSNCPSVNETMAYLYNVNKNKVTYVKYPVNWPGQGDPYNTTEINERVYFYWVTGVPQMYLDARDMGTPLSQTDFNERYDAPSYVDIKGSFTTEGSNIKVIADFMTYKDLDNVNAFVVVNEKTTEFNYGTTDETEWHHIMMKMLGGTEGTKISLKAGEYKRLEFTYDMSNTYMEDINDLEVALWVQNLDNWEVYNSNFAYGYSEHPYPAENLTLTVNGNDLDITWDEPQTKPMGYNLYVNNRLVKSNTLETSYTHNNVGNFCIVKVETLYQNMQSVNAVKVYSNGLSVEENDIALDIYPNPVENTIYIDGMETVKDAAIYSIIGNVVYRQDKLNDNNIDVSHLNSGIYLLKLGTENGDIVKKFIKK